MSAPSARAANAVTATLILLSAIGCRAREEAPAQARAELVAQPLAALAAAARPLVEPDAIELADPAARSHLWSGLSEPDASGAVPIVRSLGASSELVFDWVEPRDVEIQLRGWSFPFPAGPEQTVEAFLGAISLGRQSLPAAPTTLRFAVPGSALVPGENRLELRYGRTQALGRRGYPIAATWVGLRFRDVEASLAPRFDGEDLLLDSRTGLRWVVEGEPDLRLTWDATRVEGGGDGPRLEIWSWREGELFARGGMARGSGGTYGPLGESGATEIGLVALETPGVLRVVRPRFERPAPPRVSAESTPTADAAAPARPSSPPNLIVYLVDTLRADRVGAYRSDRKRASGADPTGASDPGRDTTPAIDRFAAGATRFAHARAVSSWTRPTVASITSGLAPLAHGAMDRANRLPDEATTLAELLRPLGYQTAFVSTNANTSARFGFAQGVDFFKYFEERKRGTYQLSSPLVHEIATSWLAGRDPKRPFFLFLHVTDPHAPYAPPPEFRQRFAPEAGARAGDRREIAKLQSERAADPARALADALALYDAEIASADASFGRLLAWLDDHDLAESTAVVFVADHGEEFLEHGKVEHGKTLYEEQLRIPLVVRLPDGAGAGRVVADRVDQLDLYPTIAELVGATPPPGLAGTSLLAAIRRGASLPTRAHFARLDRLSFSFEAVLVGDRKLVRRTDAARPPGRSPFELFDLATDPGELANRAVDRRVERELLLTRLALAAASTRRLDRVEVEIDPETERALRALGYVN